MLLGIYFRVSGALVLSSTMALFYFFSYLSRIECKGLLGVFFLSYLDR